MNWIIDGITAQSMLASEVPTFKRGGSETVEFLFTDDSYQEIKDYIEFEGSYPNEQTLGGEITIREFLSDNANIQSKIVTLDAPDVLDFPDTWIAIIDGEDTTQNPGDRSVEMDIVILAKQSEYDTKEALLIDIETPFIQL